MPATGVFVIATTTTVSETLSAAQLIFNNLASKYHLEQLPAWTLDHRAFREASAAGESTAGPSAWLQVVHLSHLPGGHSYAAVVRPAEKTSAPAPQPQQQQQQQQQQAITAQASKEAPQPDGSQQQQSDSSASKPPAKEAMYHPATIVTMPSEAAGEELSGLMANRFGPLWTRRQVVHVAAGQAYRGDGFIVRFGEAREARPGQGGAAQLRATVAEITATDPAATSDKVREIWAGFEIKGAKDFVDVPGAELGLAGVRQWIEALRPRVI